MESFEIYGPSGQSEFAYATETRDDGYVYLTITKNGEPINTPDQFFLTEMNAGFFALGFVYGIAGWVDDNPSML